MATTLAWREREREREREELVTFLGQIPGKVWEYTNTSVTYDMVHDTHDTDDTYTERAGGDFDNFCLKNHWVFDVFMLKSLRNLRFWKDFVLRARMCTLPYFLQGILAI